MAHKDDRFKIEVNLINTSGLYSPKNPHEIAMNDSGVERGPSVFCIRTVIFEDICCIRKLDTHPWWMAIVVQDVANNCRIRENMTTRLSQRRHLTPP